MPPAAKRAELAAFLRTRRERIRPETIRPEDGVIAHTTRRRTPGLRREEVAQLAGVGVTWYTWLEQGRPINASTQVLDAIARTLRLDPTERAHLFRLAEVPGADMTTPACDNCPIPDEVQQVLDAISPYPASAVTEMFDLLAWNDPYATFFPNLTAASPAERNTLYATLVRPACCHPVENRHDQIRAMVATLRAAYGRHVGDRVWTSFITRMEAASEEFAAAWRSHDVAQNVSYLKVLRHPALGRVSLTTTSFDLRSVPGSHMVVYTAAEPASTEVLLRLAAGEGADARFPCWPLHYAERALASAPA
jgi:transcriptional regulator with XRE-family HTH domain